MLKIKHTVRQLVEQVCDSSSAEAWPLDMIYKRQRIEVDWSMLAKDLRVILSLRISEFPPTSSEFDDF